MRRSLLVLLVALLTAACIAGRSSPQSDKALFGRLLAVDVTTAKIENLEFLTGDEATKAYGMETGQSGGPPNAYWIRDLHTTATLNLDPTVSIVALGCDDGGTPSEEPLDPDGLVQAMAVPEARDSCWTDFFWFHFRDGRVVRIAAQYLP